MSILSYDKEFLSTLFKIALPITIQQFVTSFLNIVDVVMIGQLGETSIAALGLANQLFFLLIFLLFGISSGSAIFIAQFWGQRDIKNIRKVMGIGLTISVSCAFLFSLVAVFLPEWVLSIYSKDSAVIALGSSYLRVVGLSYVATAITVSYSSTLRSMEQVKLPMFVSFVAFGLNAILSYGLIFGQWGFPLMGVVGAAVATCIARFVECSALLFFTYSKKLPAAAKISEMFAFDLNFLRNFSKTMLPVVFAEMAWSFGITTYNIIYARMGTESLAAINIAATIEELAFVIFIGLANACAIMIGNKIGEGEEQKAYEYGGKLVILGITGSMLMGCFVFAGAERILSLYKVSQTAHNYALNILTIFSLTMWVRVSNMNLFIGILRSGGDTRFAFMIDSSSIWLIGVPLAFSGAFIFHLPIYWVYSLVVMEEFVKFSITLTRYFSRKWINNLAQLPKKELLAVGG